MTFVLQIEGRKGICIPLKKHYSDNKVLPAK